MQPARVWHTLPGKDRELLEEIMGSFPWWDPKTVSRKMANAGDGIDRFLASVTNGLHH